MNAKPRAFEPRRLLDALRAHAVLFCAVALLGLFGGAALARMWVPSALQARAVARIVREPHVVYRRALEDDVLERALREADVTMPVAQLRARTRIGFAQGEQLRVSVTAARADSPAEGVLAGRLADALVDTYVALANERVEQDSFDSRRQQDSQQARALAERERAHNALTSALAREGVPALPGEQQATRTQLATLEAEASAAAVEANASHEQLAALQESAGVSPARGVPSGPALAEAQRALSRLLAESGDHTREAAALRARIAKLQQPAAVPSAVGAGSRTLQAEARAQDVRARGLALRVTQLRQTLARLDELAERVAPQRTLLEQAEARVLELAAHAQGYSSAVPRSAVLQHAELSTYEPRALRLLVSLLLPVLALFLLASFFALRELKQLRVRAATELSHWLRVPVLTTSEWPARPDALEPLVDALADPALHVLGTTLLLPLTELERPLAATLVAQLNARAQRHFRSPTGSRITIAQDWQGELDSARIRRAAEVADRVLWVVAADVHHGPSLAARRSLLADSGRVAAVLVDAEPRAAESRASRSVGDARAFWRTREAASGPLAPLAAGTVVAGSTVVAPQARVPLH